MRDSSDSSEERNVWERTKLLNRHEDFKRMKQADKIQANDQPSWVSSADRPTGTRKTAARESRMAKGKCWVGWCLNWEWYERWLVCCVSLRAESVEPLRANGRVGDLSFSHSPPPLATLYCVRRTSQRTSRLQGSSHDRLLAPGSNSSFV